MLYDINIHRIKKQLTHLKKCIQVLQLPLKEANLSSQFALERALHISIECIIDIGTVMIDGFIMRDPGGYLDILEILEDEKVVSQDLATKLKKLVRFRKNLIYHYDEVTMEKLYKYTQNVPHLIQFDHQVQVFLNKELGVHLEDF